MAHAHTRALAFAVALLDASSLFLGHTATLALALVGLLPCNLACELPDLAFALGWRKHANTVFVETSGKHNGNHNQQTQVNARQTQTRKHMGLGKHSWHKQLALTASTCSLHL